MTPIRRRPRLLATFVAGAAVAAMTGGLAGCSGDSESPEQAPRPSPSSTPGSASATETPYLPVPDGVQLTAQGATLAVGDEAVVAYEPRQDLVGVLAVTVDRIEKTTFKESFAGWKLGADARRTTPYFVRARISNEGATDLGGRPVPLYIVDSDATLIEPSTFQGTFKPCPSKPFPKKFGPGAKVTTCLVYLAPEGTELAAVSFRPTQEFNPITWTGPITKPRPAKPDKGKNKGKGDKGTNSER